MVWAASLLNCAQLTAPASPAVRDRASAGGLAAPAGASETVGTLPALIGVLLHTPTGRRLGKRLPSAFEFLAYSFEISRLI